MDFVFRISSDVKAMEQTRTRLDLATIAYVTSQGVFLFNTQFNSKPPTFFIQMKNISGKDIRTKEIQALVSGDHCDEVQAPSSWFLDLPLVAVSAPLINILVLQSGVIVAPQHQWMSAY